jgi:hypothetical protein
MCARVLPLQLISFDPTTCHKHVSDVSDVFVIDDVSSTDRSLPYFSAAGILRQYKQLNFEAFDELYTIAMILEAITFFTR